MSSSTMFILSVLVVVFLLLALVYRRVGGKSAFKEWLRLNPGILKGIILFTLFGIVLAWSCSAKSSDNYYFSYLKVFAGIDRTFKQSTFCHQGEVDDKLTSNGGLILNLIESYDLRYAFNLKHTHHSCALNKDNNSYDAIGIHFEYSLW